MSENSRIKDIRLMILAAVFAALIAISAQIKFDIPMSPAPITLQTLFVLLAGLMLPPLWAGISTALYLLVGLIGIPVFANGARGVTTLLGTSGGFLIGFIVAALAVSLIAHFGQSHGNQRPNQLILDIAALFVGTVLIYGVGVPWLIHVAGWDWSFGLANGVLPYLPGDVLKLIAALLLAGIGRKLIRTDA